MEAPPDYPDAGKSLPAAPTRTSFIACHECDMLQRRVALPPGGDARCRRCGALLYRNVCNSLDRTLAYLLGAAVLYFVGNIYPIVGLDAEGTRIMTTLTGAAHALWSQDMRVVAFLVFFTTILAPAVELFGMLYILVPLKFGKAPAGTKMILRTVESMQPWSMVEVFMLGVLVSLVKLSNFADVVPDVALWSFGGLTLLMTAAAASFNADEAWAKADKAAHHGVPV